jgi:hypothetical protein
VHWPTRAEVRSGSKCEELTLSISRPLLPAKAAVERTLLDFAFVPEAAVSNRSKRVALFDHLVGERQQFVGHFKAERLRGSEIDHEVKFGGLLDRQVRWLLAFENTANVIPN